MIRFKNVTKQYNSVNAVDDLSIDFHAGKTTVLIGPSGCGKTTTLKMINRLIEPTEGQILINDQDISKTNKVELRRNMGYVIQQIGLFPHMNIADNVGLVPYLKDWEKEKRTARVNELLDFVGMPASDFAHRHPFELSGGQQQRIGVARALGVDPQIILMDEPFGALDPITRASLQDELLLLQDKLNKTIIFVTHDMDEALKLADYIVIMREGRVVQYDTPENILKHPADTFVENFIGKERLMLRPSLLKVSDVMIKNPVSIYPHRSLVQAHEKMRRAKVDSLMVIDENRTLLGIVYAREVVERLDEDVKWVSDAVNTEVQTVNESVSVSEILSLMAKSQIGYVVVVDEANKLLGLVTRSSILNVLGNGVSS